MVIASLIKRHAELKDPSDSFEGKTIIITGANTGLGLAAATKFAKLGASHLILAVRSVEKGKAAKATVQEQSKAVNPTCKIEVWQLNMLSYNSIKVFAARASSDLERLDIAVLNAGIIGINFELSTYKWENVFQVNTISTTLLALLLLPKLKSSKTTDYTPTLELVGSEAHWGVNFDEKHRKAVNLMESYNNLEGVAEGLGGQAQYARSKMFLMYATEEMAKLVLNKKTGKPDVFITTVCPGPCKTDFSRNHTGLFFGSLKRFVGLFQRTPEQGSRSLVSGTLLGEKGHGQFWKDDVIQKKCELLTGEDGEKLQRQVWREIVETLKIQSPEILKIIS